MTVRMERPIAIVVLLTALGFCRVAFVNGATLTGTFTPVPRYTNLDLTAEGRLDWVHWGLITDSSLDRKAGVTPQIPDFIPIRFNGPYQYSDNFNGYSWTDGTPTRSITYTTTGVWMFGKSNGFELDIPVGTATNILKVYVGAFAARGKFDAALGGTTLKYSDDSINNATNGPGGVYTLTYAADAPAQTLTVKYVVEQTSNSTGNVTLQAATLTAPGANNPPSVDVTSPTGGANFSANDDITIAAFAADADGQIVKVEFFQNGNRLGQSTNAPYSLTWHNVPAGNYVLTATTSDNGGAAATSAPVQIFVSSGGGTLSGSFTDRPPAGVDLTAEGVLDWTHWGLFSAASFDRKSGGTPFLSNFTKIGAGIVTQFSDNSTGFSWTNGAPTLSTNDTRTGVYIHGLTNGFSITAPADTNGRMLKVYVGLYGAGARFQAYLSDFSAPAYTDTSLSSVYDNPNAVYTLIYAAASPAQTLTVEYTAETLFDADYGSVTLESATLSSNVPPTIFNPEINAGQFQCSFQTRSGVNYTVESADSLSPIYWQTLTNLVGNGAVANITDSNPGGSERFYRVVGAP